MFPLTETTEMYLHNPVPLPDRRSSILNCNHYMLSGQIWLLRKGHDLGFQEIIMISLVLMLLLLMANTEAHLRWARLSQSTWHTVNSSRPYENFLAQVLWWPTFHRWRDWSTEISCSQSHTVTSKLALRSALKYKPPAFLVNLENTCSDRME